MSATIPFRLLTPRRPCYSTSMAGNPLKRAMLAGISKLGGLNPILDRVANGETIRSIAVDVGCSRSMLTEWLHNDAERRALYLRARATSADALAESALDIADASSETGTSKARLQVETRQWLAGVYDREQYGQQKPGVTVNIGQLHLDALRQRQAEKVAAPSVQVIDTKVLTE